MPQIDKAPYETKSAVLFVVFNRPDTTSRVFEQIRVAKPQRLYIAADAPRADFPDDDLLCKQTRAVIQNIDWDCKIETLLRKKNLGCREAVSSAVTWFFNHEEEGIILEDDCLPANSFFKFCDTLLDRYRHDTRIRHITGCNLQQGRKWGNSTYYFSNRTHVWGWASWRRVWKDYDKNLNQYNSHEISEKIQNIYSDSIVVDCWVDIFKGVKEGKINSWAYQLDFANFFNNGLTIIPNENLISNIGFGVNATHTVNKDSIYANLPVKEIDEITNPIFILPEKQADLFVLNRDFDVAEKRRKQNILRKRVRRWFKSTLQKAASIF
jgi:hypothetical protein